MGIACSGWTTTEHIEEVWTRVAATWIAIAGLILAFVLTVEMGRLKVLDRVDLCILSGHKVIHWLLIFELLEPLESFLHVLVD